MAQLMGGYWEPRIPRLAYASPPTPRAVAKIETRIAVDRDKLMSNGLSPT